MKTHSSPIIKTLSILLAAAIFVAGCQPALAKEVAVEDTAPAVEFGGPSDADFVTANGGGQMAMLYVMPTVPRDATLDPAPAPASPLTLQIGTGRDTRLGVDVSAINAQAEREGWPWYAWAGIVVGSVAVIGLTAWAISEASKGGGHSDDSSHHTDVIVNGDGNTVNVHPDSESNSSSSTRTGY